MYLMPSRSYALFGLFAFVWGMLRAILLSITLYHHSSLFIVQKTVLAWTDIAVILSQAILLGNQKVLIRKKEWASIHVVFIICLIILTATTLVDTIFNEIFAVEEACMLATQWPSTYEFIASGARPLVIDYRVDVLFMLARLLRKSMV